MSAVLRLFALVCLLTGCTGVLVDSLQERHISSCVFWSSPLAGARGVTATGLATISQCLEVPCRGH